MKKILGATVACLLAVPALAACGGDDNSSSTDSYCKDIQATQTQLKKLDGANDLNADTFNQLTSAVHNIAGEAPSDVKGSWTLLEDKFNSLKDTMSDFGMTMDDFGKLTQGQVPPDLDQSDLLALEKRLKSFGQGMDSATKKIHDEVKSECGIDLNKS